MDGFRNVENPQKRRREDKAKKHYNDSEYRSGYKQCRKLPSQLLLVMASEEGTHKDTSANTDSRYPEYEDIHHRPSHSSSGKCLGTDEATGYHGIDSIIKELEHVTQNKGNRVAYYLMPDVPLGHIYSGHESVILHFC